MADKRRLFFALWPDHRIRQAIARAGRAVAQGRALGGRDVPVERLHLTLLFLGDASARQEEQLLAGAGQLGGRGFDLRLDRAACFFRTRAFWVGVDRTPARLAALWQDLGSLAGRAGLAPDPRPLAPHVTVARDIRHRIRPVAIEPIVWPVRHFALVHSIPGSAPQYHVVSQWPLHTASSQSVKTVQEPGGPE